MVLILPMVVHRLKQASHFSDDETKRLMEADLLKVTMSGSSGDRKPTVSHLQALGEHTENHIFQTVFVNVW